MKKWIAFTLTMLLILSLCACDKNTEEHLEDGPTAAPTAPPTEPADPPEPPAPAPNFYLLTEISASVMNQEDYAEISIRLHYDENRQLIGADHYVDGVLSSSMTYRENTLDLLTKLDYREDGQVQESYVYDYDEKGNLLTITGTDASGAAFYSVVNTYDENGWPNSTETFYDGQLSYWESYRYSDDGLRESYSSGDGLGNLYHEFQYSNVVEDGKLKGVITLNNGEYYHTVAYNDNGDPITEVTYASGYRVLSTIQYTYTESGKPLAQYHTDRDGKETYRMEYVYDEQDRLTEYRRLYHDQLEQNVRYTYVQDRLAGYESYTYGCLDASYSYLYESVCLSEEQTAILSDLYAELMKHQ